MKKEYKELTLDEKVKIGKELFSSFPLSYAKKIASFNFIKDKKVFFLGIYELLRDAGSGDSDFSEHDYDDYDNFQHNKLIWHRVEKPNYMRKHSSDYHFEYQDYFHCDD